MSSFKFIALLCFTAFALSVFHVVHTMYLGAKPTSLLLSSELHVVGFGAVAALVGTAFALASRYQEKRDTFKTC